jgi:hypothetical protein
MPLLRQDGHVADAKIRETAMRRRFSTPSDIRLARSMSLLRYVKRTGSEGGGREDDSTLSPLPAVQTDNTAPQLEPCMRCAVEAGTPEIVNNFSSRMRDALS